MLHTPVHFMQPCKPVSGPPAFFHHPGPPFSPPTPVRRNRACTHAEPALASAWAARATAFAEVVWVMVCLGCFRPGGSCGGGGGWGGALGSVPRAHIRHNRYCAKQCNALRCMHLHDLQACALRCAGCCGAKCSTWNNAPRVTGERAHVLRCAPRQGHAAGMQLQEVQAPLSGFGVHWALRFSLSGFWTVWGRRIGGGLFLGFLCGAGASRHAVRCRCRRCRCCRCRPLFLESLGRRKRGSVPRVLRGTCRAFLLSFT